MSTPSAPLPAPPPAPPSVRVERVDRRGKVYDVPLSSLRWSKLDADAVRYSLTDPGEKATAGHLPYVRQTPSSKWCVRVTIPGSPVEVPPKDAPFSLLTAFRKLMAYRPHVVEVG